LLNVVRHHGQWNKAKFTVDFSADY
jgi:hypothetical protein